MIGVIETDHDQVLFDSNFATNPIGSKGANHASVCSTHILSLPSLYKHTIDPIARRGRGGLAANATRVVRVESGAGSEHTPHSWVEGR